MGTHIVPVSKTGKFNIGMYFSVRECLVFLLCSRIKKKHPHPKTGRRQSNGTRTGRKDTDGQKADCAAPPRSLLPLLPAEQHISLQSKCQFTHICVHTNNLGEGISQI